MAKGVFIDVENNTNIERELTDEEQLKLDESVAESLAQKNLELVEAQAKAQTKAEILERIGITEDEAKLLLS
jgi:predicted nucleic acid-binding OB-fold protein